MISKQPVGIEFGLDSNVHIEVVGPNKDIRQTIDVHNKATKRLVSGIMHFIRGEMHPSTRREDVLQISNTFKSQDFIPCYINIAKKTSVISFCFKLHIHQVLIEQITAVQSK